MDTLTRRNPVAGLAAALVLGLATLAGCGTESTVSPIVLPPLRSVTLSPGDTALVVGQGVVYTAVAIDTSGNVVTGATFGWTSTDAGVASVNSGGVLARGEGEALIIVTLGDKSDTARVEVSPTTEGWFAQSSGTVNALHGVFFRPSGRRGWAVGAGGRIVATTDAGVNWALQSSSAALDLNAVWFTSDSEGWVVGNGGVLRHTINGGGTWSIVTSGTAMDLYDVCFATPDTGWAVGASGVVLRTFDRGANWTLSDLGAAALRGVSFAGTRFGWAVGDNGTIATTVNRGLDWSILTPSITTGQLRSVWRSSLLRANAVGAAGVAPRSADDGFGAPAWTLLNPGAAYQFKGVCFPTELNGWSVGLSGTGFVLRSDDGGQSWTPQSATSATSLNDVFFVDAERGWAVGDGGVILHTATGGIVP